MGMPGEAAIDLRMPKRRPLEWFVVPVLICLGLSIWALTRPMPDPVLGVVVGVVVLAVLVRLAMLRPSTLTGTTLRHHGWLGTRDIEVAGAPTARLRSGGTLTLGVRSARGGRAAVVVCGINLYLRDCLPPPVLDRLAGAVAAAADPRAAETARVLRLQAAHLAAGRPLEDSPLAAVIGRSAAHSDAVQLVLAEYDRPPSHD